VSQIANMQVYEPTGKPILYVWLDYETQSAEPISSGAARYAQHHTTRAYIASVIICEADGLVQPQRFIWTDQPWQLSMPEQWEHVHGREWLHDLFADDRYEIWCIAHNTSFERSISEYTLHLPPPARWIDTMDTANSLGLPAGLDKLGAYCYQTPKDSLGKNLMMRLCMPPKHGRNRGILPTITQEDIQNLITYSITDTVVCRRFSLDRGMVILPKHEQEVRDCHHGINHLGIGFDLDYAEKLDSMEQFFTMQARLRVEEVTGGEIKGDDLFRVKFLTDAVNAHLPADLQITNMRARTIEDLLEDAGERDDVEPEVLEVLKSRLIVTRAALDKVRAAMNMVCSDGRIRDQFVYWGAGPGRWSGRGVQPQNLRRPGEDFDLQAAIDAVKSKDSNAFLRLCVDERGKSHYPYELLGSLVRGIFIPRPGYVFVVGDYASIEARMLMWMADQAEGLQEHRDADAGKIDDVYCAFASSIYGYEVRKKTHKKERQAGKVGQLAGGYGGGEVAMERMAFGNRIDLAAAGVTPKDIVQKWRSHYYMVPRYWGEIEQAFRQAAVNRKTVDAGKCRFWARGVDDRTVQIELPSGRQLNYMNARMRASTREGREGQLVLAYDTMSRGAVRTKEVYGGLLTENCLGGETLVATLRGNKPIASITPEDYLWDGHDWVQSRGAISRGTQEVGLWLGVQVTADHLILAGEKWLPVTALDESATLDALARGRASAPWSSSGAGLASTASPGASATAEASATTPRGPSPAAKLCAALRAAISAVVSSGASALRATMSSVDAAICAPLGRTAIPAWSAGAMTPATALTATMAGAASASAPSGWPTVKSSSATPSPFRATMSRVSTSTARTIWATMSRAIYGWWSARSTPATDAAQSDTRASGSGSRLPKSESVSPPCGRMTAPWPTTSSKAAPPKRLWSSTGKRTEVFDILACGPRSRFTVITAEGPVIVHNCDQAMSRDCLARTIRAAVLDMGYDVPLHVHDEVVLEVPEAEAEEAAAWLGEFMSTPPAWAPTLPLSCKPSIMHRYGKD
jgi:DNA polymerase